MSLRSRRLAAGFAACSMTPRSGKKYVDELVRCQRAIEEQVYAEGKLALARRDFAAARALLGEVPPSYKRAARYVTQCEAYERLCETGAVHREGTRELRQVLADLLGEEASGVTVNRYTEALVHHGYRPEAVVRATLKDVKPIAARAGLSEAHRARLRDHAERQTPLWERAWLSLLAAVEECGGVAVCFKTVMAANAEAE